MVGEDVGCDKGGSPTSRSSVTFDLSFAAGPINVFQGVATGAGLIHFKMMTAIFISGIHS